MASLEKKAEQLAAPVRALRGSDLTAVSSASVFARLRDFLAQEIIKDPGSALSAQFERTLLWKLVYHRRINAAREELEKIARGKRRGLFAARKRLRQVLDEADRTYSWILSSVAKKHGLGAFPAAEAFDLSGLVPHSCQAAAPLPAYTTSQLPHEFAQLPPTSALRPLVARVYLVRGDLVRYSTARADGADGAGAAMLRARACYLAAAAASPALGFAFNQMHLTIQAASPDYAVASAALLLRALVATSPTKAAADNFRSLFGRARTACRYFDNVLLSHAHDTGMAAAHARTRDLPPEVLQMLSRECGIDPRVEFGAQYVALLGALVNTESLEDVPDMLRRVRLEATGCLHDAWPESNVLAPCAVQCVQAACFAAECVLAGGARANPIAARHCLSVLLALAHELADAHADAPRDGLETVWGPTGTAPALALLLWALLTRARSLLAPSGADAGAGAPLEEVPLTDFAEIVSNAERDEGAAARTLGWSGGALPAHTALELLYTDLSRIIDLCMCEDADRPDLAACALAPSGCVALDGLLRRAALPEDATFSGTPFDPVTEPAPLPEALARAGPVGTAAVRRARVFSLAVRLICVAEAALDASGHPPTRRFVCPRAEPPAARALRFVRAGHALPPGLGAPAGFSTDLLAPRSLYSPFATEPDSSSDGIDSLWIDGGL
eukprot:gnl/Chilomastix_cuspidata/4303.p1 GENE.gnl/Chilomastix_cuspidata/4303~~gnl/Chilomastix_cuspidata/4303.p1  ORF type:complete len:673 (-),score=214.47 gnl/Chilomastix_cuspidata/4303:451-2469(-)